MQPFEWSRRMRRRCGHTREGIQIFMNARTAPTSSFHFSSLLHRARFHSFTLPKWIAALVAKCENYLLLFVCSFYFCAHRLLALFSLFVWLSGDPSDCQERLATSSSNARAEAATAAALILIWIVYESIYLNPHSPSSQAQQLKPESSVKRRWEWASVEKSEIKKL